MTLAALGLAVRGNMDAVSVERSSGLALMAVYHCSIKPVCRAKGQTATGSAAYRSASRIRDVRTGEIFDYSRKRGVEHTEIVLPLAAVKRDIQWARDRLALWNEAELAEVRKDARVAREYELALPHELSRSDRVALARQFSQEMADRFGVAGDFAIHRPHRNGDQRNYHVHLLTTTRQVEPIGLGAKAAFEWSNTDRAKRGLAPTRDEISGIRQRWGQLTNELFQERGLAARVDHRSLKDQGIDRRPTTHLGPAVMGMQRRGIETEVSKRIAWEHQRTAQERLEWSEEQGRLERESRSVRKSILDLTADLAAARQERAASLDPARASAERWLREYGSQPRVSLEETAKAAARNWAAMREATIRARAFEQLPELEALKKHPELKSTYEAWRSFEKEMTARFPDAAASREGHTRAGRSNVIARLEKGELFNPWDVSAEALTERLNLDRDLARIELRRDQGLDREGPELEL